MMGFILADEAVTQRTPKIHLMFIDI